MSLELQISDGGLQIGLQISDLKADSRSLKTDS
jgi:hypothetical protein